MHITNTSSVSFVLLGFSDFPWIQTHLFLLFLSMYLVTLVGNMVLLFCIAYNHHLHSPMYFFLGNLSLADIGFTSSTIPSLLSSLIVNRRFLSFPNCITQMFFFITFGNLENNLLAIMAYDRYVAICSPLHYATQLRSHWCVVLVIISWVGACSHSLLHTLMAVNLSFSGVKQVDHFFCEISRVLSISSSDTSTNYTLILTEGAASVGVPFVCIILSYALILRALLQLHTVDGRQKAFSTCSSHLITVCIFYGTIVSVYFCPYASTSRVVERAATIGYTLLTPMLNPIIYGLRNNAMKAGFKRMIKWKTKSKRA
ncbi:olfactory receptor 1361-like [Bombina bombina]|uniref:olfactory receptor 1361-like n=1 Tax=Bombina bombina TaxID=8345 RepID=UPI00235AB1FD|nr:olfactory receptor 1361-like [Bombina bombina]